MNLSVTEKEVCSLRGVGNLMPHYRLYLLDSDNKIIEEGTEVECLDDDAAVAVAKIRTAGGVTVEVWAGSRYVDRVVALE